MILPDYSVSGFIAIFDSLTVVAKWNP